MKFQFRDIADMEGKMHIYSVYNADETICRRKDVTLSGPIDVKLWIEAKSYGIARIHGQLTAAMELQCARCLILFNETYVIPFDEQFKLKGSTDSSPEREEIMVTDDCVDLKLYVEEALFMKMPYAPLCNEACKGLCPICGNNRNEHRCGCLSERINPRLAVLQHFFKK